MKTLLFYTVITIVIGLVQTASAVPVTVGPANGEYSNGVHAVDIIISNTHTNESNVVVNPELSNNNKFTAIGIEFNYGIGSLGLDTVRQDPNLLTPGVFGLWTLSLLNNALLLDWQTVSNGFISNGTVTLASQIFTDTAFFGQLDFGIDWYPRQNVKGSHNVISAYIPEPGTFLLVGSGLLGLLGFRRRVIRFRNLDNRIRT